MNSDISEILKDWPYKHGKVMARKIRGADGKEKIQLRIDLGLLQMEATGRPDGRRPHGCGSMLEYYQRQEKKHADDPKEPFELDERACELLRNEGMMYYHRYLAEFVLEDYEAVIRDTSRNLQLMDFCSQYAQEDADKYILEQYRPYVVMMRTRANGLLSLRDNRPKAALAAVQEGMKAIEDFYNQYDQEDLADAAGELAILKALAAEIEANIPVDPIKKLKKDLARAVHEERYEEAAGLRDKLRLMTGDHSAGGDV